MRSLFIALCSTIGAVPALCQDPSLAPHELATVSGGDRYVERSAGFSWYSPRGKNWGSITNRRVYVAGLRGEWVLGTAGSFALASTAELLPLVVVERTAPHETMTCYGKANTVICERDRSARLAVGAGASPLGLKLYLNRTGYTRLYASGAAGSLIFSSDVPVTGSRHFNYTFEYGGGVELVTANGRTVSFGYKFHHISNGATAPLNPGLDSNILYVGLRRHRPRH
jgi:lipid A 3-O-deacylase PagL